MIARHEAARRIPVGLEAWEAGAGQTGQSGRRAASVATATARRYGGRTAGGTVGQRKINGLGKRRYREGYVNVFQ